MNVAPSLAAASRAVLASAFLFALAPSCGGRPPRVTPTAALETAKTIDGELSLVESFPKETSLDHSSVADADVVWPRMIAGAQATLDIAHFYAVSAPGARLEQTVLAIEAAARRGVHVRVLLDETFFAKYPELAERLGKTSGIGLRRIDFGKVSGGVQHAKYFVVDGHEAYLGSQNFDWRSLEHIFELGVRVRQQAVARALGRIFEVDWAIAGGMDAAEALGKNAGAETFPALVGGDGSRARVTLVASPRALLPDAATWDLPRLVALIAGARRSVHVELLTYATHSRDGAPFPELDDALRRAAARGVAVRLLVSDWSTKPALYKGLLALADVPNVEVRVITIPRWSGGDIPFARVAHAKYLVVDGACAWVGTSNWEGDYFTRSRNVGLVIEGESFGAHLDDVFASVWSSVYATPVRADAEVAGAVR